MSIVSHGKFRLADYGYYIGVRVTTGIVRRGKVEIDDTDLPEGTAVTVLVPENGEDTFEVTADEKAKLVAAIRELEHGEVEDGWDLLRRIRPK